jgi:hypothetical protein
MQAIELTAQVTNNHEVHLKLPNSIRSKAVKVIVLYEQEAEPPKPRGKRTFGQFRGEITVADDFDAPLPDSFWGGEE